MFYGSDIIIYYRVMFMINRKSAFRMKQYHVMRHILYK